MSQKIQVRRGTAAIWAANNPTLLRGEIGFEYDTVKVKIGDGSTAWNSLPYAIVSQTMVEDLIAAHEAAVDPHPQYETSAEAQAKVDAHANLTNNPHSVTKSQVGLGNVDNTSDANKPISTATQAALDDISTDLLTHENRTDNPHSVTKAQVGLSDVPNVDATQRANHTGTQTASTISDFADAVNSTTLLDPEIRGEIYWAKNETDPTVPIGELVSFASTMGLTHGGGITVVSGRTVSVAALSGYTMINVPYATHQLIFIEKEAEIGRAHV